MQAVSGYLFKLRGLFLSPFLVQKDPEKIKMLKTWLSFLSMHDGNMHFLQSNIH